MTKTLFDLTYEVASEMGILQEGTLTGGSTETIVDSIGLTQKDNYWIGGSVWITYDAAAGGVAPQGEMAAVTDSTQTGTTVVTKPGWTTTTAVGDRYAISKGGRTGFRLEQIIGAVNRAVRDVGYILVDNTTAVTTAASQTEYTLPIAANTDLREVHIQTLTNDTTDNRQFAKAFNWEPRKTAGGTADTLIFQEQPTYPRDVLLKYMAPHAKLNSSADELDESIREERVIYRAAYYALAAFRFKTRNTDDYLQMHIDELKSRADTADIKFPIKSPKKTPKIMSAGYTSDYDPAPGENTI
jgi:hypothetical protein